MTGEATSEFPCVTIGAAGVVFLAEAEIQFQAALGRTYDGGAALAMTGAGS